ncbi:uncharacterized protein TNCV_1989121 [Trichonephila clavipes]|nr:uncharacterized protein TNCV_1989121 [Trichonephila clavipes]
MQIARFNKTAPAQKDTRGCKVNFLDMISSEEWPPHMSDLSLLDYSLWTILEFMACIKPHKTLDSLKLSLLREWDRLKV